MNRFVWIIGSSIILFASQAIPSDGPVLAPQDIPKEARKAGPSPEKVELAIYDVRDLLYVPRNHKGGNISMTAIPDEPLAQPAKEETPIEAPLTAEDLATLLKERLLAAEFSDPATTIDQQAGKLIVMQRPAIHAKIRQLLAGFRKRLRPSLQIQGLMLRASQEPDKSLLSQQEIDALVHQEGPDALLASPSTFATNGQRVATQGGMQRRFIADLDVAGAIFDPVVHRALEGFVLEVKPTLSFDRHSVGMEVHFALNERFQLNSKNLECPIGLYLPEGGPSVAGIQPARLDLPSQDHSRVETQVNIPVGTWFLTACFDNRDEKTNAKQPLLLLFLMARVAGE